MKKRNNLQFGLKGAILGLAISSSLPLYSQQEIDIDARRKSIVTLEQHIAQKNERLEDLASDIRSLDGRVEEGLEEIVLKLSEVSDSDSSRVQVSQMKGEFVGLLRKSIDFYGRHRDQIKEQLRTGSNAIPKETLESDLAIFNERIEKRVEQIKKIAESFTEPKDLEKYEVTSTSSWGWRSNEVEEISDAWRQNRRDSQQTDSMRGQMMKGLEESVDHLTQRNAYLSEKLKTDRISESERMLYQSDLEYNTELIGLRKQQMDAFSQSRPEETRTLSQNEAHDAKLLIADRVADMREDFLAIFRKYAELNKERGEIKVLVDNLAARKQWLVNYDKENQ